MSDTGNMNVFGRATIAEFLGDNIVYRNLAPMDERLPGLQVLWETLGLPQGQVPRKVEPAYAQVMVEILRAARALEFPESEIKRLLFVGDTRMNDGTAFAHICQSGEWPGMGFIGSENAEPSKVVYESLAAGRMLYLANRWSALHDFDRFCQQQNFPIDESTAVIVDLDKTALGARGRNAHVIDQARVQAVKDTVAGLLGIDFDEAAFREAYDLLNQVEYHPFTRDNQDYLAYICLILGSGLYDLQSVVADVRADRLGNFESFIQAVDARSNQLPPALAQIHAEIYANVQAGDPTPFKAFRRNEYLATVAKMGFLGDDQPVATLLESEIVITQEVRQVTTAWRDQGAILFGLSDKPDEASIPTQALEAQGYLPIHRQQTHVVGRAN